MVAALDMSPLAIADQRDEMVIANYRRGYSLRALGEAFGVDHTTIRYILIAWDVPLRRARGQRMRAPRVPIPPVPAHLRGKVGIARLRNRAARPAVAFKPRIVVTAAMQTAMAEPEPEPAPLPPLNDEIIDQLLYCPPTAPHKEWFRDAPWKRAGGR